MPKYSRRDILRSAGKTAAASLVASSSQRSLLAASFGRVASTESGDRFKDLTSLRRAWREPARTFKPHTRWWWPGCAVTRDGITWELDQMRSQGIGGVEIAIVWKMFEKGNHEFLSQEFLDLLAFAVQQAKARDMEVSISFCPGWNFGGFWVDPTDRSKVLMQSWEDLNGPGTYDKSLPITRNDGLSRHGTGFEPMAHDHHQIVGVVAARLLGERLDATQMIDLTDSVVGNHLTWRIPAGQWKLMAYRIEYTGQICSATDNFAQPQWVVDFLNADAVSRYCEYLGNALYRSFGEEFGKTVDTLFCDSFEMTVLPETIHWTNGGLKNFKEYKGYDLRPYLPGIWWDIGEITPKIRYDVNDFLGRLAMNAMFKTFIRWCSQHNLEARMQPYYRCTEELIEGAGTTPRPEMEVSTARFAVITDPRKAVASGAHLYGRPIISAEAYTFLHTERYRTTLQEMKVATDAFLRDGVTQFYNHGYLYSPEMNVAPSRDVPFANRISHWNTWWKSYRPLADYIARSCVLLRQGEFVGDVLIYSPQATVWAETVLFENKRRIMPYGDLGQLLVANGYDFDLINDDVLQHSVTIDQDQLKIHSLAYRCLVLPKTTTVPVETMRVIERFVNSGGLVIALDALPASSVGMRDYRNADDEVKAISQRVFLRGDDRRDGIRPRRAYFIEGYKLPNYEQTQRQFDPGPQESTDLTSLTVPQVEFLDLLKAHIQPDFKLPLGEASTGLTFMHRRVGEYDIYFITNLQDDAVDKMIKFRVPGKTPEWWDAMSGDIQPVRVYEKQPSGVSVRVKLKSYESGCVVFSEPRDSIHVTSTTLKNVLDVRNDSVSGIAAENGIVTASLSGGGTIRNVRATVADLPEPYLIQGNWRLELEGIGGERVVSTLTQLASWTRHPAAMNVSGSGRYSVQFQLPETFLRQDMELELDLGMVGTVATVSLNGEAAGITWMQPYRLNITDKVKKGSNRLEVWVENTLINYVAGLNKLPEVPENLVGQYGSTETSYHSGETLWQAREKSFHPLPESGLLGPVRIVPNRRVTLSISD